MIKLAASKARKDLSRVIQGAGEGERFLLLRHNKGVAAIVSVEDLALLQAIEDRRDRVAARLALQDAETNGTVPWEQVKAELGL
jgi:antitoxin (DNA-binding transcriptional repressor) of toxin-antitoxin stability system